jgi:putative membrane protein
MSELLFPLYPWLRAFHILAVIAWMAGLLYLPRLYVYHMGAAAGGELDEALKAQERRLLRAIMNPAMIASWTFGVLMLAANPGLLSQGFMHVKLLLVVLLTGLHHVYSTARKKFERGERPRTERTWRILNEAPAVLAILIVILVVVEPFRGGVAP